MPTSLTDVRTSFQSLHVPVLCATVAPAGSPATMRVTGFCDSVMKRSSSAREESLSSSPRDSRASSATSASDDARSSACAENAADRLSRCAALPAIAA